MNFPTGASFKVLMSEIGWELREEIDFSQKVFEFLLFEIQFFYDVTMQFQKNITAK